LLYIYYFKFVDTHFFCKTQDSNATPMSNSILGKEKRWIFNILRSSEAVVNLNLWIAYWTSAVKEFFFTIYDKQI